MIAKLLILVLFASCGKWDDETLPEGATVRSEQLDPLINESELTDAPDLQKAVYLLNRDYPLEIALYKDKRFFYNLDNLGEGEGSWGQNAESPVTLFASRSLFDMRLFIYQDKATSQFWVAFRDRHGVKRLPLEQIKPEQN